MSILMHFGCTESTYGSVPVGFVLDKVLPELGGRESWWDNDCTTGSKWSQETREQAMNMESVKW